MKIIELFGGIGAIRKAAINTKLDFKIIDYVENDDKVVKIYNSIYNEKYNSKDIKEYHLPNIQIDILMHGSPCQDFSIAGYQKGGAKGSNTRSSLLYETIRIIKEAKYKPKWIIWENVPNVLNKNHINIFNSYIQELNNLGYESTYKVLNSLNFGIPQNRNRIFCVSYFGNNPFLFDDLEIKKTRLLDEFLESTIENKYIVKQKSFLDKIKNKDYRLRIIKSFVNTITTKQMRLPNAGLIKLENNQYRYLTEKECWRLMGYTDLDFELAKKQTISKKGCMNGILYKVAGNSIVVSILEEILKEIYKKGVKQNDKRNIVPKN